MTGAIDPARFTVVLNGILHERNQAPDVLTVTRDDGIVTVAWGEIGKRFSMRIAEQRVIDNGGPEWVAKVMGMRASKRRETLMEGIA